MATTNRPETPQAAWDALVEGNKHFVSGSPAHPRQDIERREALAAKQIPLLHFLDALTLVFLRKLFLTLVLATYLLCVMQVR